MRRLADELGTGPASLYRHISSRDEFLVEVADLVLGESCPGPGAPLARTRRAAGSFPPPGLGRASRPGRDHFEGPVLRSERHANPGAVLAGMDRDGCDPEFAVQTYSAVMHFVVCSAIFTAGAARRGHIRVETSRKTGSGLDDLLDLLPAGSIRPFSSSASSPTNQTPRATSAWGFGPSSTGFCKPNDPPLVRAPNRHPGQTIGSADGSRRSAIRRWAANDLGRRHRNQTVHPSVIVRRDDQHGAARRPDRDSGGTHCHNSDPAVSEPAR